MRAQSTHTRRLILHETAGRNFTGSAAAAGGWYQRRGTPWLVIYQIQATSYNVMSSVSAALCSSILALILPAASAVRCLLSAHREEPSPRSLALALRYLLRSLTRHQVHKVVVHVVEAVLSGLRHQLPRGLQAVLRQATQHGFRTLVRLIFFNLVWCDMGVTITKNYASCSASL